MEQWRDIPGYEGIYQASTLGNIRTCERKVTYTERHGARHWRQRVMKQKIVPTARGRLDARVNLWKDGKEKTWLVARLVGLSWCDGFSEGMTINHINGKSLDNRAENLEWVTLASNIKKGFENGLYSANQSHIQLSDGENLLDFSSMAEASRFLSRNRGYVYDCLRKNRPAKDANGNRYNILMG